jgi:hypothetical protein
VHDIIGEGAYGVVVWVLVWCYHCSGSWRTMTDMLDLLFTWRLVHRLLSSESTLLNIQCLFIVHWEKSNYWGISSMSSLVLVCEASHWWTIVTRMSFQSLISLSQVVIRISQRSILYRWASRPELIP